MADISPILHATSYDVSVSVWTWENVTENDTCLPVAVPHKADKTIMVDESGDLTYGTSGAVTIEGSLDPEGGIFLTLTDPNNSTLVLTASTRNLRTVLENVYLLRPRVTAGTGVELDIWLMAKGR